MKCRIGLNAGGDLAAIRFRHCDIEGDRVRLKILRSLMTFAWVVLFPAKIAASRFQSALGRVGKVAVVIDYQDAWLLELFRGPWREIRFDRSVDDFPRDFVASLS